MHIDRNEDIVKKKGEVFTPNNIAKYMTSFIDSSKSAHILEPSCGNGAILQHISPIHHVTGIDIQKRHINTCKKIFPKWTFVHKDFTKFQTSEKFDYIIGNPPYVKIQNLDENTIQRMKHEYPIFIQGNTNLFIYFIAKGLDLLNDNGKLIYIIPNTLLYNKSFHAMKQFLMENRFIQHIIDFKDTQVFANATTYTCILVLTKKPNPFYTLQYGIHEKLRKVSYNTREQNNRLAMVQPQMFTPRIGIMTLADHVYIIKNCKVEGEYISFEKNNKPYIIEKGACMNILKVSKNEIHRIIYPYLLVDGKVVIDTQFDRKYPLCYKYLLEHKDLLDQRDHGNVSNYSAWYAYGRTQSLVPSPGKMRIFLPTVVRNIHSSMIMCKIPLFYSGLYIEPSSNEYSNKTIKDFITKNETRILQQSNHRSGGWFSLSHGSFYNLRP